MLKAGAARDDAELWLEQLEHLQELEAVEHQEN